MRWLNGENAGYLIKGPEFNHLTLYGAASYSVLLPPHMYHDIHT